MFDPAIHIKRTLWVACLTNTSLAYLDSGVMSESAGIKAWDAAIALSNHGPFLGGGTLGLGGDAQVTLLVTTTRHSDPWIGFSIEVPHGPENEDLGFGVQFQPVRTNHEHARFELAPTHNIKVSFFFLSFATANYVTYRSSFRATGTPSALQT